MAQKKTPPETQQSDPKAGNEELGATTESYLQLLWDSAALLLATDDPDTLLHTWFNKIGPYLGLDTYLHHVVDNSGAVLQLASYAGMSPAEAARKKTLHFGEAIAGTVAERREMIVATHIQESTDPRAQLVKSYGIRVYACNPLVSGDCLFGTLSFASRSRDELSRDELDFLKTITRYLTIAYQRLQLIDQLRNSDRRKDEFIATLAHELRNPLAPISSGLTLLKMSEDKSTIFAHLGDTLLRQTEQLVRLVDDLLDVSRISHGSLELRKCVVDIAGVVTSAMEASRPAIDEAGHELIVSLPPSSILLNADPHRLAQIVSNLLNNSAKYTPEGGRIWLTVETQNDELAITVKDTGIGISADRMESIFDMFAQVKHPAEKGGSGLGIGLALIRSLVLMHGGTVQVRSEGLNCGSEFCVRLPYSADTTTPEAVTAEATKSSTTKPRRILVVDDNKANRDVMSMFIKVLGHDVRTASDGQEAFDIAAAFSPEVVLMDLGMPGMDGYEAARRIREQDWGKTMTLVALTGWGKSEDKRKTKEAGFDEHLVKPSDPAELQRVISGAHREQP